MKKKVLAICCTGLALLLTGCSASTIIDRFVSVDDTPVEHTAETKPRVYMDEIKGTLLDFTGDTLTITAEGKNYVFDVSSASLECENGMITGDEITVIYEGQLPESEDSPDTSQVTVLKVVNDYRMPSDPASNATSGIIQELTPNHIILNIGDGKTITFPTTGCEEYFSGGIRTDVNVTVHYLGSLENAVSDGASPYDAFHVKAVTVSDVEPFQAPSSDPNTTGANVQTFQGVVQSLQTNALTIEISGSGNPMTLDLSNVPSYFPGGPMSGSKVTVSYQGTFNGTTLEGISLVSVTGEDPAKVKEYHLSFSVTGNIRSHTENTVTILTTDGAYVTFRTDDAENSSTGGLEIGSDIRVIFNPEENRTTNVYSCFRIQDA